MTYDTAVPRTTFLAAADCHRRCDSLVGFSAFFGAVVHGRRNADAPRVRPSPSVLARVGEGTLASVDAPVLGQTAAGYLLVSVFLAYDVMLYLVATRISDGGRLPKRCCIRTCWRPTCPGSRRSPTRSRPDSGKRRCSARCRWPAPRSSATASASAGCSSSIGFIVQALIFGAGMRRIRRSQRTRGRWSSFLPSIGFGLLYVDYGLLPGIILHYAFDVVLFALPIFLSDAPGIWFQKAMVVG